MEKTLFPKKWYRSKAILSAFGMLILATLYGMGYIPEERMAKVTELFLEALGLIGLRTAVRPVQ